MIARRCQIWKLSHFAVFLHKHFGSVKTYSMFGCAKLRPLVSLIVHRREPCFVEGPRTFEVVALL